MTKIVSKIDGMFEMMRPMKKQGKTIYTQNSCTGHDSVKVRTKHLNLGEITSVKLWSFIQNC